MAKKVNNNKLKIYRHYMENAKTREKFEFWQKAYNTEWIKIYGHTLKKSVDK